MITLDLHSPQPPSAVLAALRARAGEWRQSQIPPALWHAGISAVEARVRASTCTLTFRRRWYGPAERTVSLCARATVAPDARGTSIRVVVAYRAVSPWLLAVGFAVATVIGVVLFGVFGLVFFGAGVANLALQHFIVRRGNRDLTRASTAEADYLVSRVQSAVASAGKASEIASAS